MRRVVSFLSRWCRTPNAPPAVAAICIRFDPGPCRNLALFRVARPAAPVDRRGLGGSGSSSRRSRRGTTGDDDSGSPANVPTSRSVALVRYTVDHLRTAGHEVVTFLWKPPSAKPIPKSLHAPKGGGSAVALGFALAMGKPMEKIPRQS